MKISKIKISALPETETLKGCLTLVVGDDGKSYNAKLDSVQNAVDSASTAAESANTASKNAEAAVLAANEAAVLAKEAAANADSATIAMFADSITAIKGTLHYLLKKTTDTSLPVQFIDYDGTVLFSFSLAEAQALTALPPIQSFNERLVAQGWTHTLSEVVNSEVPMQIGALYTTKSGATEIDIQVRSASSPFIVNINCSGEITIDWGDGTVETKQASGISAHSHMYASIGLYTVKISVPSGTYYISGNASTGLHGFTDSETNVIACYIGDSVTTIGDSAFYNCSELEALTIPSEVATIGLYTFCLSSIKCLIMPRDVTTFKNQTFYRCEYLRVVVLPVNLATIGSNEFRGATNLVALIIPGKVTSIGNNAFYGMTTLTKLVLAPYTPPTLGGTTLTLSPSAYIYVYDDIIDCYQAATNWVAYVARIRPTSQLIELL